MTPHEEAALDAIICSMVELPDRTSPDDWPEAMLVTAKELREIVAPALFAAEQRGYGRASRVARAEIAHLHKKLNKVEKHIAGLRRVANELEAVLSAAPKEQE